VIHERTGCATRSRSFAFPITDRDPIMAATFLIMARFGNEF
jgi:hypothetical protein